MELYYDHSPFTKEDNGVYCQNHAFPKFVQCWPLSEALGPVAKCRFLGFHPPASWSRARSLHFYAHTLGVSDPCSLMRTTTPTSVMRWEDEETTEMVGPKEEGKQPVRKGQPGHRCRVGWAHPAGFLSGGVAEARRPHI